MTAPRREAARPLKVVVATAGKQLFAELASPSVAVRYGEGFEDADLIVLAAGTAKNFREIQGYDLPKAARARAAAGDIGIVLDGSTEGVDAEPGIVAAIHSALERWGVSPLNCVYVTQNRQFRADYLDYVEAHRLGPAVEVLNHDFWIWFLLNKIAETGEEVYREKLAAFRARPAARPKRFISLNMSPRPAKILFLLSLLRDRLWDRGFISFGGFDHQVSYPRPSQRILKRSLPGFEDLVGSLYPLIDSLADKGRLVVGEPWGDFRDLKRRVMLAPAFDEYDQSWLTVITETEMRSRPSRITEKPFKPLVNFHPLLTFGNPGSLKMIRDFGFATFGDIFDESYDEEPDPRRRFDMVYAEFRRLMALDDSEWAALERKAADSLMYNARFGLTQAAGIWRRQREDALLNGIVAGVSRQA